MKYEDRSILGDFLSLHSRSKEISGKDKERYYEEQYPKFLALVKKIDETDGRKKLEDCYNYINATHPDSPFRTDRVVTMSEIMGTIAQGWCSKKTSHKVMDVDLANAITWSISGLFIAKRFKVVDEREIEEA